MKFQSAFHLPSVHQICRLQRQRYIGVMLLQWSLGFERAPKDAHMTSLDMGKLKIDEGSLLSMDPKYTSKYTFKSFKL